MGFIIFDVVMWQLCFIVISSVSNIIIIFKQKYSILMIEIDQQNIIWPGFIIE